MNTYEKALVNFFGTTDNINEAGYILRDGTLLDFSGRHLLKDPMQRKYYINDNVIQHYDILGNNYNSFSLLEVWQDFYETPIDPVLFILKNTNAISVKVHEPDSYLRLICPPSDIQLRVILKHFEERSIGISYVTNDGYIVDDAYITFLTERKLKAFIFDCTKKKHTGVRMQTTIFGDIVSDKVEDGYLPMKTPLPKTLLNRY